MFKVILLTLLLLLLVILHDWLANHWESLKWPILIVALILGMIGNSKSAKIPTYAERHLGFNRVMDENPWMKIFYAVYAVVVVVAVLYAVFNNIDVAGIGFWGFMGALVALMIPIFIYKLKQLL